MRLNSLTFAPGARQPAKRVGRGMGSGLGKTCGRGHKGQHSRAGGFHKVGFEGGQMPLQRRIPKHGFRAPNDRATAEVRLHELNYVEGDTVDLVSLKAANVVPQFAARARIILSGEFGRAVVVRGVTVSKGARAAIEAAGGKVEE